MRRTASIGAGRYLPSRPCNALALAEREQVLDEAFARRGIGDVANLSLQEVAHKSRTLIQAVRKREVQADDLKNGVFTISNLGELRSRGVYPHAQPPETAVLGLGAIRWEPVVLPTGTIVAREQMTLSLTFDHRVVDGAPRPGSCNGCGLIDVAAAAVHCP